MKAEKVYQDWVIQITLSREEAVVLRSLVGRVGGDDRQAPRRVTSAIWQQLEKLGIESQHDLFEGYLSANSVEVVS